MDSRSLSVLSLCAGVGGLDLGIRMAQPNARTVCFVEIEAFACEILATRMEDKTMDEAPIWTDLRTFDGKPWRVASWIALLRVIRASPLASRENKKGKTTQDISGQMCFAWFKKSLQDSVSLKTYPDIYDWGLSKSTMTYPAWVAALRQACSQRRKSVHLINGSDCSFWRTVKAKEPMGGCLTYKKFKERLGAGMPLSLRDQVKHMWPTVRVSSANGQRAGRTRLSNLREQINWPTPIASEQKYRLKGNSQQSKGLTSTVIQSHHSRPGQMEIGTKSQPVLNPQFVEWLMGWPIGWTEFEPVETVSSHWLPLMRGSLLQLQEMENNFHDRQSKT